MSDKIVFKNKIEEYISLFLWILLRCLGHLPVSLTVFCSDVIGLIWFHLDRRHRTVTIENLTFAYGKVWSTRRIRSISKKIFKNFIAVFFEIAWTLQFDQTQLQSFLTIKGLKNLQKAHRRGKGVILLSCHLGNFEMLLPAFDKMGLKAYVIYRPLDWPPLERFVLKMRERYGVTMIPVRGGAERLEKILSQGGIVGTMLDQNVDWYQGVFVDFFDRPACTHAGLAKLAMKTEAAVVPMYTIRKNRRFLIEFFPELHVQNTGDLISDIEKNTHIFNLSAEFMIRKYPDQYFWLHNRWKTKPYSPLYQEKKTYIHKA